MIAQQIINKAKAELGITEYPPGSNNVKYNTWYYGREVHDHDINPTITYPWCCVFISWLFKAEQGLCKKTASSSDLYRWFLAKNQIVKTPQPGDIVFFKWNAKKDCIAEHVGIVISVSGNVINTIEGNTSQSSNDNGGKVMQRNRYSNIVGYARPNYKNNTVVNKTPTTTINVKNKPMLRQGSKGDWVKIAQGRLVANGLNIVVDGDFGPETKKAVLKYQGMNNLEVDGIIGPKTWAKLYP